MQKEKGKQKEKSKYLQENIKKIKHKLIILSGKGGVGKSTVAVNLAYGLANQDYKVGILDVDIHGPSIAKLLGIEGRYLTASSKDSSPEPIKISNNLYALTIASLLRSPDDPVIWRGPLKMNLIKQFLGDIKWPELDYLIVDCPPGTGDEPLSAVQIIGKMDGSIIVSTPQDLSLLDARKAINFSKKINVPVLGIVQNMSGFNCPHCGKKIDIFQGTGTEKTIKDFNLELLGNIPIDHKIVISCDKGRSYMIDNPDTKSSIAMKGIVEKVIKKINKN